MNSSKIQIIIGALVLLSLFLLTNPFDILMLDMMSMVVIGVFAVATLSFVALVWGESTTDERDSAHRGAADRVASLAGSAILGVLITIGAIQHNLDPALPIVLGVMVLAKLAARIYYHHKN